MNETWESQFVDKQVDRAWLDLRLVLAEQFAAGMANTAMDPVEITTATGETLTVTVDDAHLVIVAGDDAYTTANVDEAAYTVFQILTHVFQVVHPAFLDSELVDAPSIPDEPVEEKVVVPVLGKAQSQEQLHEWVVAALSEWIDEPVKVSPDGSLRWRTPKDNRVMVSVRNGGRIEFNAVLARRVGFRKAHEVMGELSRKWFGLKFFLVQDSVVMSQIVIAYPFVAEQLTTALSTFIKNVDELGWVQEKVLSKRAKADRTKLAEAEKDKAAAEAAHAEAEKQKAQAERVAERRKQERTWVSRNLKRATAERDAAQAELAELKAVLGTALGHKSPQDFTARPKRGDVA